MAAPQNTVQQQGLGVATADNLNTFIQWTSNLASLRGFIGAPGMMTYMQGYAVPNDGGQGLYYWSASATAADNGTSIVRPSGVTVGAWLLINLGVPSYVAAFEFLGATPPLTNEIMGGHIFPVPVTTNINFAGAQGHCEVNPTATFTALIYHIANGVATQIGTMTISTSGVFTFAVAASQTFNVGDSLKIVAPSGTDATLANLWWSILGVIA